MIIVIIVFIQTIIIITAVRKLEHTNRERTKVSELVCLVFYEQSALPRQFEIVLAVLLFTKPRYDQL